MLLLTREIDYCLKRPPKNLKMVNLPLYFSLDDVLLIPQRSDINSRSEVDLSWSSNNINFSIPIIASNMDCVTGVDMAIAMGKYGGLAILPRFDAPEVQAHNIEIIKKSDVPIAASIGVKDDDWHRLELLVKAGVDHVNVDVAHGHLSKVIEFVASIRQKYPKLSLSAGVIGTYAAAVDLFDAGVDIIRVGVGPGSACTTRLQAGSGVPQFTAITECAKAARKYGKIVWADGGTKNSGDIVKCLAAGASAVISGSQLAGCDECPVEIIIKDGKKFKPYNGSASLAEKQRQVAKYSLGKDSSYVKHVEGVEKLVPYKGHVGDVIDRLIAGIKSGYSYSNARTTQELWENARFCQVTSMGARENATRDGFQI